MALYDPEPFQEFGGDRSDWRQNRAAEARARFMASSYGLMAGGLMISAAAAFLVSRHPQLRDALLSQNGPTLVGWCVMLSPLLIAVSFRQAVMRLSADAARAFFLTYAALVGVSLANVLLVFTSASVGETLAAVSIGFAALAGVGSILKTDLSRAKGFMVFTLCGLMAAMIFNLLVGSRELDLGLSLLIILFFSFATLHDTQRLEQVYDEEAGLGLLEKGAILGALTLYLDLLNPLVAVWRIAGRRR